MEETVTMKARPIMCGLYQICVCGCTDIVKAILNNTLQSWSAWILYFVNQTDVRLAAIILVYLFKTITSRSPSSPIMRKFHVLNYLITNETPGYIGLHLLQPHSTSRIATL